MSAIPALSIDRLTCRYGDRTPLDGVELTLEPGEILGVTGTPGAGMSTLVKAIMLLVAPQAGRVLIYDGPHELASHRAHIGYLPETIRPPGHLSGNDFIAMTRTVQSGNDKAVDISAIAGDLDLESTLLASPIRRYAKEDVQKLAITALLAAGRPILLLDRPMADLEPSTRAGVRHRLRCHTDDGGAVLIVSHRIEDHQDTVDRLLMLKDGRLDQVDTLPLFKRADGDSKAVMGIQRLA